MTHKEMMILEKQNNNDWIEKLQNEVRELREDCDVKANQEDLDNLVMMLQGGRMTVGHSSQISSPGNELEESQSIYKS